VLSPQSKPGNQIAILTDVLVGYIAEEPPALANQLEEASASGVVFVVPSKVVRKTADALCNESYLYFR
jgi:hypothetical protein